MFVIFDRYLDLLKPPYKQFQDAGCIGEGMSPWMKQFSLAAENSWRVRCELSDETLKEDLNIKAQYLLVFKGDA